MAPTYAESKKKGYKDFPGGPVAKIMCSQLEGAGFDPWSGSVRSHAITKSGSAK